MSTRKLPKVSGLIEDGKLGELPADAADRMPAFPNEPTKKRLTPATPGLASEPPVRAIVSIPLDQISDSPWQPRLVYEDDYIQRLADSLKHSGQREPITVRRILTGYELISGHCRKRAALLLGWKEIDGDVVELDDREAELSALIQADTRSDISDFERSEKYRAALESGLVRTQVELAEKLARTPGRISQALGIQNLPEPILAIARTNPKPFTSKAASAIQELIKSHPNDLALITDTVQLSISTGKLTGITQAFRYALEAREGATTVITNTLIVTDNEGQPIFQSKAKGSKITITVAEGQDFPLEGVQKAIMDALRALVSKKPGKSNAKKTSPE
jgi:ParB/RepB/Spo0J family partition protein